VLTFDPGAMSAPERARLLTCVIAPRPIALVSSLAADGTGNLAPFSFFAAGGSSPLSCVFSPTRDRHGDRKDTLANIEATGEYVICAVTESLVARVNQASFTYPASIDEFDAVGLTRAPSQRVRPPRVLESPVALECRAFQTVRHGEGPGAATYVIGEILAVHVDESVCVDGFPDESRMALVARLGAERWSQLRPDTIFTMSRPSSA